MKYQMTSIMTSSSNLTFLKNNVKGLQSLKKRIKLIEYFKGKLKQWISFLQETYSNIKNENYFRVNYFSGRVLFSHGASNSCGALIAYLGKSSFLMSRFSMSC